MNRKILYYCCLIFTLCNCQLQAQIAPYFFGENAWMPDTIGYRYVDLNGKLHNNWSKVKDSHATSIRIGGKGYDKKIIMSGSTPTYGRPTTYQLLRLVDSIRAKGAEPIIQIPVADGYYNGDTAAKIVTAINITNNRHVKYWIIGNEPNGGAYPNNATADKVRDYIIDISPKMKAVDTSIKIIAPEITHYISSYMTDLIGGTYSITGKPSGKNYYYVDYISFHYYPFDGTSTQNRTNIISKVYSASNLNDNLSSLTSLISSAGRSSSLKIVVDEANIDYATPDTTLAGVGPNSFLAGQFWVDIMGACMKNNVQFLNFWSVIEGGEQLGYLRSSNATKKPTWYHFNMVANNFKGTYSGGTVTTGQTDFKGIGSYDGHQIAVILMNQNSSTNYTYTVRLDNNTVTGTNTVKIKIPGPGLGKEYSGTLNNQSTVLLLFDPQGNLSFSQTYGYSNGYGPPPQSTYCGTSTTLTSFGSYVPGIYQDITFTPPSGTTITLGSSNNSLFRVTNSIKISQPTWVVPSGQTFEWRRVDCQ